MKKPRPSLAEALKLIARFEAERELKRRRPLARKAGAKLPVLLVGGPRLRMSKRIKAAWRRLEPRIQQQEKERRLYQEIVEHPELSLKKLRALWPVRPGAQRKASLSAVCEHYFAHPTDTPPDIARALDISVKTARARFAELERLLGPLTR